MRKLALKLLLALLLTIAGTQIAFSSTSATILRQTSNTVTYELGTINETTPSLPVKNNASTAIIRVPQESATLPDAINRVSDGGVIELAAGTYYAPPGGFRINNRQKSFTIRSAPGAKVVLDGGGQHDILRFQNSSVSEGRLVVFKGLIFANGRSTTNGVAGGVTMHYAQAIFINCTFRNNVGNQPSTGGGGIAVALHSTATFRNCSWRDNAAKNFGGGLSIKNDATVNVIDSDFHNNVTNRPGHSKTAAGGGIHIGNSDVNIFNTHFEGNQAGYVGGAVYAIGEWAEPISTPRTRIVVTNSTFVNNHAIRDASVSFSLPTEAGAIHFENQVTGMVDKSTFNSNSAMIGGAVNLYRADVTVSDSVFDGNVATGAGAANGFGGALSATSNDTSVDGNYNRRSSQLTIRDTLILGEGTSQAASGIYIAGDQARTYGNGVSQMGTLAQNRATLTLQNVILDNTDVQATAEAPNTGTGGAIVSDLAKMSLEDVLVANADAKGNNSSGGGLAVLNNSYVTARDLTVVHSTSDKFGAALFIQGSTVDIQDCNLILNEISPGVAESAAQSYGAAVFASPDMGRGLPATGTIAHCVISENVGQPIFDDDRTNGPVNDIRYNGNTIYSETFGDIIYTNSLGGYCCKSTSDLNSLVVTRANGINTPKSQVPNTAPATAPPVGVLQAIPPYVLPENTSYSYLGYTWSGKNATLNGQKLSGNSGLTQVTEEGTHTLSVDGTKFSIEIAALDQKVFIPIATH